MASLGNVPVTPWAGQSAGFDILQWGWKQLHDQLVRYAYRLVRQRQVAEDVVIESFVRAHQKILGDEFRGVDRGSGNLEKAFRAWIYRIVRNICVDHLRQHLTISIEDAIERTVSSENSLILSVVVGEGLNQLPPQLAVAVQLCDLEDLTAAEAAQSLDISIPALKSRLYRGREKLRYLLRDETINWLPADSPAIRKSKKPKRQKRKVPKTLLFIDPRGFIPTIEKLAEELAERFRERRNLAEITTELKAARRYPKKGEPLSDLTREAIIDLIFASYPDSDAKAMRWVQAMTTEYPPRPDTPGFLLPPPVTPKPGR